MKLQATHRSVLLLILCSAIPASAQLIEVSSAKLNQNSSKVEGLESADRPSFASDKSLSGVYQLPTVRKAEGDLAENPPVFVSQDALTLSNRLVSARKTESVLDLSVLREPSAYRNATRVKLKVSDAQASGISAGLKEISAAYTQPGKSADCASVTMSVEHRIQIDPSQVLEIVESEISANGNCACEIVKIAIKASGADEALVADITEVAITSAPESMRMISQCAIAAMPEALPAVQAVLAKLDPNRGDSSYSAKDSKSGKDAVAAIASAPTPIPIPPNPINLPPNFIPPIVPPPYLPPSEVTNPNPIP
jgi:hypothetical protein